MIRLQPCGMKRLSCVLAEACVAALVSKRVTLEQSPSAVSVDPRYLVFELTASVVLRDQQLELVRTFGPVHK